MLALVSCYSSVLIYILADMCTHMSACTHLCELIPCTNKPYLGLYNSFTRVTCSLLDSGQHLHQSCHSGALSCSSLSRRQPAFRANFIPASGLRGHGDQACFSTDARVEGAVFAEGTLRKHDQLWQLYEDRKDVCALDFANMHPARIWKNG